MSLKMVREFFKFEASGGIVLAIAALIALIMHNSPLDFLYDKILETPVIFQIGEFGLNKPLLLWINDGLMAIFFLLVGLEIKQEVVDGQLSKKDQIALPALAAFGGFIVPALIFSYINWGNDIAMKGWAIPTATDIAFSLGVVSLLGRRVPESLKLSLMAMAIIDDLMAIVVIAVFYTDKLSGISLLLSAMAIAVLFVLNRKGVTRIAPYILTGIFLWICVLKSGVHATLAGVVLAMFIPVKAENSRMESPALELEHSLHPWVAFAVLPVFAFANAGVSLTNMSFDLLLNPITLAIILALFFGKQAGVMLAAFVGKALGVCKLPEGTSWAQYYAMAIITGIGFTMSLFIGTLAFTKPEMQNAVRLGVVIGSMLSGIVGYMALKFACRDKKGKITTELN